MPQPLGGKISHPDHPERPTSRTVSAYGNANHESIASLQEQRPARIDEVGGDEGLALLYA